MLKKIGIGIGILFGLFIVLGVVGAIAGPSEAPMPQSGEVSTANLSQLAEQAPPTPPAPQEPSFECPEGFSKAGTRGCFTVDSVASTGTANFGIKKVRGRVISKKDCETLVVSLSGLDAEGRVLCDGNGMVSDVAGGTPEPWDGQMLRCSEEPSSVSLKIATCM